MPEFAANTIQTVEPGASLVFTTFPSIMDAGLIVWDEPMNAIILKGVVQNEPGCCAWKNSFAQYYAQFSANIQIPTDGEVGEISLAIAINGEIIPTSQMIVTPAAAEELQNVSTQVYVPVPKNCCQSISVRNTSDQAIEVQNANLNIFRPDLSR